MPFIHWIHKLYNLLLKIETALLIGLLLSTILIAVAQILLRNLFDIGLFWAESYIRISVLWVVLLGATIASRNNEHIAIDFFVHKMTEKIRSIIQKMTDLFSAVICAVMAYHSLIFIQSEYADGGIAFSAIPNWFCEAIIPFTFAIIAIRYLVSAIFNVRQVT
jgi:TRAP-type C4-dicarboxylate transport system permease small subunit